MTTKNLKSKDFKAMVDLLLIEPVKPQVSFGKMEKKETLRIE